MFFRATIFLFFTTSFFWGTTAHAKQDSLQLAVRNEKIVSQTDSLIKYYNATVTDTFVLVNIEQQQMLLVSNNLILKTYLISTSKEGVGAEKNSNKTPLGVHRIKNKIGHKAAIGTVFFNTLPSRQVAKIYTDTTDTPKDHIITRIMWLDGQEPGKNKGDGIDSYERCIYIHGTHEEGLLGRPVSMGCIRMKNIDIVELFNLVKEGTLVSILAEL
jgi:L,D-peptidoglycan transpeptidase YkuD (ErfK/YbiS/YcfS/YnhG family)